MVFSHCKWDTYYTICYPFFSERNRRLERENARKRENRSRKQRRQEPAEIISENDENDENFQETDDRPLSANIISEDEHKMLKKF